MSEHQQQLFLTLMNQLQLDTDEFLQPDFDQASLTKIDITKSIPEWCFYIETNQVIQYEKFKRFYEQLKQTYEKIAQVRLMVNTREESAITQEQIQAYWEMVLFQLQQESPLVVQLLSGQIPTWNQKKYNFIVQMKLPNLMSMKITLKKFNNILRILVFQKWVWILLSMTN